MYNTCMISKLVTQVLEYSSEVTSTCIHVCTKISVRVLGKIEYIQYTYTCCLYLITSLAYNLLIISITNTCAELN